MFEEIAGHAVQTKETLRLPRLSQTDCRALLRGARKTGSKTLQPLRPRPGVQQALRQVMGEDTRGLSCGASAVRTVPGGRQADPRCSGSSQAQADRRRNKRLVESAGAVSGMPFEDSRGAERLFLDFLKSGGVV